MRERNSFLNNASAAIIIIDKAIPIPTITRRTIFFFLCFIFTPLRNFNLLNYLTPLFYHIRTYNSNKNYFLAKAAALLCQLDFIIIILGTCAGNIIRIYYGYNPTQQFRLWQFEPVYWNLFWNHQHEQNNFQLCIAPHATPELDVIIADEPGEYACFAGMWWTPENRLAYMEPLCTIPEYRQKGLAAAALSEMYRRTKALGATHMTGGNNPFYRKIGYQPAVKWIFWQKQKKKEGK